MFVTEIRPLNKKKSRILFDDGEDLVLYNGEIRASRIKEQEELPDEVYEKLAGEVLTKRAKHRTMNQKSAVDGRIGGMALLILT